METRTSNLKHRVGTIAALALAVAMTAGLFAAMALDLQRTFEPPPGRRGVVIIESCPECDVAWTAASHVAPAGVDRKSAALPAVSAGATSARKPEPKPGEQPARPL